MASKLDFNKFFIFNEEMIDGTMTVAPWNYKDISFDELKGYYLGNFFN